MGNCAPSCLLYTSCSSLPAASGATVISTSGVIMPGMLDGHNHGLFNIFDEADWSPGKFYGSHNDWTSDVRYQQVLDAKQYLNKDVTSPVDLRCETDKYAEIKALIAGTTSFTLAPGAVELACYESLARTIDTSRNDLGVDRLRTAISVPSTTAAAQTICNAFTAGTAKMCIRDSIKESLYLPIRSRGFAYLPLKVQGTVSYTHLDVYKRQDRVRAQHAIPLHWDHRRVGRYLPGLACLLDRLVPPGLRKWRRAMHTMRGTYWPVAWLLVS